MNRVSQWLYDLVQECYDHRIRDYFPRTWIVNNGVPTRTARLLDRTKHRPDCKQGSVTALREHVRPSDHVVVIGGGDGVTAVVAARRATQVTVYEAASRMVSVVEETAEVNAMADKISVNHSVVGPAENVYGDDVGAQVDVADLPNCDVLELDCEGAEGRIIAELSQLHGRRPRVIIIETHPQYGTDIADLRTRLSEMDYYLKDLRFENKPHVIAAIRKNT